MNQSKYEVEETLHQSARTIVQRAVRTADGARVVVKTHAAEAPSRRDLARLRREFHLLQGLGAPGAIRAEGLELWGNGLAIIEEHFDGSSLDALAKPMELDSFLDVAIAVSGALSSVHAHVVHGGLAPAHVLWNPKTRQVRLIDFARAWQPGVAEDAPPDPPSEGLLPYLAPEHAGRMTGARDHRADLYSLGAIFFELLTGSPPFVTSDPAELTASHVTRKPPAPQALRSSVPRVLSDLVLMLLSKSPDERHQSAGSVKRDLEECARRWRTTGKIDPFPLAQADFAGRIRAPAELRGRGSETEVLLAAFRTVKGGDTRAVIISGEAGVGKSALVEHVQQTLRQLDAYCIRGKFDQFGRATPYSALAEALRQLALHILSQPDSALREWSPRLQDALAPNGQLAIDLVPEMGRIIGPQERPPAGNPVEEQNRFISTMTSLVQAFATGEHPLVLFLDDLQWADTPTLALVERLLADPEIRHFMVIGAHRGDASSVSLGSDANLPSRVKRLHLEPLDAAAAYRIVDDMLSSRAGVTTDLADTLNSRAQGNPLLLIEMVNRLGREQELRFDAEAGSWTFSLEKIRAFAASDDIASLMLARIRALSRPAQASLRMAACIGATFDLRTLLLATGGGAEALASAVSEAASAGLVSPLEDRSLPGREDPAGAAKHLERYRFQHDRVQQAAYSLLSGDERLEAHREIGRQLLSHLSDSEREERIIEIARHLNVARSLPTTWEERLKLARINLLAARKATRSAAYAMAFDLLEIASEALGQEGFESTFELAYEVSYLRAASAYLVGQNEVGERLSSELLGRARTPVEQARVHSMRLVQLMFCGRNDEAVDAGIAGLRILGVGLSAQPTQAAILKDVVLVKWSLRGRAIADLDKSPPITDERARLCLKILIDFIPPAYLSGNSRLFAASVLKQVLLCLRYGNGAESASAFASYAVLLAGLGNLKQADEFGRLALRLTDEYRADSARCRNYLLYALFSHSWSRPWSELRRWFQDAVRAGLESGDLLFTAYGCGWVYLWDPDTDLPTAYEEGRKYVAIIDRTRYQNARDAAMLVQQLRLNLLGRTKGRDSLSDDSFDETECVARMTALRNLSGLGIHALCKLRVLFHSGAYPEALASIERSRAFVEALTGSPYLVEYCLYGFLACASIDDPAMRGSARKHGRKFHRMMKKWASHSPDNFGAHLLLMDAELARLGGRAISAARLYEQAIQAAEKGRFALYQALANERAGLFYAAENLGRAAAAHLSAARDHYARWGARAKVDLLDEQHGEVLALAARDATGPRLLLPGTQDEVDVKAVANACHAISEDIVLERLLGSLLTVLQENAGASRVVLALRDPETLHHVVQAELAEGCAAQVMQGTPLERAELPVAMIRLAARRGAPVSLDEVTPNRELADDPYLRKNRPRSALVVPVSTRQQALGVLYVENRTRAGAFTPDRLAMLQMLASQAAISLQNARLYERQQKMADSFLRFVPREFLSSLGKPDFMDIRLGECVQKVMTVMHCDIRGLSSMIEKMEPAESIECINTYLLQVEPAILSNGGFIDTYLGDGITALFDGPTDRAVRAAVTMLRGLEALNDAGRVPVQVGIGLHTGPLTLGTMGGAERLKCGVVGDTVNLAVRLEGLTRHYGIPLLVSGATRGQLPQDLAASTRFLGSVRLAGRTDAVDLFEVFDADAPDLRRAKGDLAGRWQEAIDLYHARRFEEAARLFGKLRVSLMNDLPAALFEGRALRMSERPPARDWTGVEIFSE